MVEMTRTAAKAMLVLMAKGKPRSGMHVTSFAQTMGWSPHSPQGAARQGGRYVRWLESKGWAEVFSVPHSRGYSYLAVRITEAGAEAYNKYRETHGCPR